jgi:hypothetical protein
VERRSVTLEGLTPEEVLALPDDAIDALVLSGEAVVFQAGTADILGRFWVSDGALVLELVHIDGGAKACCSPWPFWQSGAHCAEGCPHWIGAFMPSTAPAPTRSSGGC